MFRKIESNWSLSVACASSASTAASISTLDDAGDWGGGWFKDQTSTFVDMEGGDEISQRWIQQTKKKGRPNSLTGATLTVSERF